MDSPLSDSPSDLMRIQNAVADGDWELAAALTEELPPFAPVSEDDLRSRLDLLRATAVHARVARADLMAALTRFQAASRFHLPDIGTAENRQNLVGPATG